MPLPAARSPFPARPESAALRAQRSLRAPRAAPAKVEERAAQSATPPPKQAGRSANQNAKRALVPPLSPLTTPPLPRLRAGNRCPAGPVRGQGSDRARRMCGDREWGQRAGQGMCDDKG